MLTPVRFANFELSPKTRELRSNGIPVAIPPKVFDCLVYLIEHRDRAVGHDELMSGVWGQTDLGDRNIAQTILKLRRALGDSEPFQYIRTLAHFGYQWVMEAEPTQWQALAVPLTRAPKSVSATVTSTLAEEAPARIDSALDPPKAEVPERFPASDQPPRHAVATKWRGVVAAAAAVVLVTAFVIAKPWSRSTGSSDFHPILVLPVAANGVDERQAWVRLGIMDVISRRLRSNAAAAVVPSNTAVALAAEIPSDDAGEARLRSLTGAKVIVSPSAQLGADNQWTLQVKVAIPDSRPVELKEEGTDIVQLATLMADRIAQQQGLTMVAANSAAAPTVTEALARANAAWIGGRAEDALNILAQLPAADQETSAIVLLRAAIELQIGHVDEAQARVQRLLDRPAGADKNMVVAQANLILAGVDVFHGDLDSGIKILSAVLADHWLDHDPPSLMSAHLKLGNYLQHQRRWDEASDQLAQARLLAIGIGDIHAMANIAQQQGKVDIGRGRLEEAGQSLQQAAAHFEALGDLQQLSRVRWAILDLQLEELSFTPMQETGRLIALNLPKEHNPVYRTVDEIALANVSWAIGQYGDANRWLKEADHDADNVPLYKHLTEVSMSSLAVDEHDPAQAEQSATRAISWFSEHGDQQKSLASARIALSAAFRMRNDLGQSEKVLAQARQQPENERDGDVGLLLDLESARLASASSHNDEAAAAFATAYQRACRGLTPATQMQAASAYLEFLLQQHRVSEAEPIAGFLSRWTSESFDAALWVARYTATIGHRDAALAMFQQAHKLAGERWDERIEAEWTELQGDLPKLSAVKPGSP
jgi:DNA-binding winged helix-turn-helix (wHTH) protein/tetratricopeptide (TPR) repeat protein